MNLYNLKESLVLYAVTDTHWLNGKSLAHDVECALKGGASCIQLREKHADESELCAHALEIQALCKQYAVPFIINDNVALAKRICADGVHLGQSDMPATQARTLLGSRAIIGVSAHSVQEAVRAQHDGADYLGAGAVFSTSTKTNTTALPLQILKDICNAVTIPVVAIGGISAHNASQLAGCGISGIAVVSAIFASTDIQAATRTMRSIAHNLL